MSRKSRRAEAAAPEQVSSPAEDFVHTAADRLGPLAQSAADKIVPLVEAAADAIGAAADRVSPLAHSAANRVAPLAQSAADRVGPLAQTAAGRIGPLAGQTVDRVTPYAKVAADRFTPLAHSAAGYAQTASDRFTPIANTALLRGNQATAEAVRRFGPAFEDARVRVSPAVAAARGRVTADLLPRLTGAFGVSTADTLVPEPVPPTTAELALLDRKSRGRWVRRIAVVGALGAVAVVVVRKFVGGQEADWQAARPSTPYVPPPSPAPRTTETAGASESSVTQPTGDRAPVEPVAVEEDFAATEPAAAEDLSAAPAAPVKMINLNDDGNVEETVVDEVVLREPVADLPGTEPVGELPRSGRAARWSGEGVYVGSEPPAGFVIKGNDRSMKYHLPEAAGYSRTIGEVWFNSEEAAQRAGFVRAQR